MADVLAGLGSVKLQSVPRSPGGTPLRPKGPSRLPTSAPLDPAAMIAAALRRKFAHMDKTARTTEEDWEEKEAALRNRKAHAEKVGPLKSRPLEGGEGRGAWLPWVRWTKPGPCASTQSTPPAFGVHLLRKSKRTPLSPVQAQGTVLETSA